MVLLYIYLDENRANAMAIIEKVVLIRINRLFKEYLSELELYEVTRGVWKVNISRAMKAEYAMAVYKGIIREVYKIEKWQKADKAGYSTRRDLPSRDISKRKEFIGKVAEDRIINKYIGKDISEYFKKGNQNPITYMNC